MELQERLVERAKCVRESPYTPAHRCERGNALFDLGYPELAAGDAHKAMLLTDAGLDLGSELGAKVRAEGEAVIGSLTSVRLDA